MNYQYVPDEEWTFVDNDLPYIIGGNEIFE